MPWKKSELKTAKNWSSPALLSESGDKVWKTTILTGKTEQSC